MSASVDISPVREILQLDGADIELVDFEGGTARLQLVLVDAGCEECVLPRPLLEDVALSLLAPGTPGLTAVTIDDPREP